MADAMARAARVQRGAAALLIGLASLVVQGAALAQAPAPGQSTLVRPAKLERIVLENGLEVYLQEDRRAPLVALDLCYHVGSKDDPPERRGLAYFVGGMLAEPTTRHVDRARLGALFERLGADRFRPVVRRTSDRVQVGSTFPSHELELALWLYSDWMGFLLDGATEQALAERRAAQQAERRHAEVDRSYGSVDRLVRAALYPASHPYATPTMGTEQGASSITSADVAAFARAYLVPNNATLVLVGSFDAAKARAQLQAFFGPIVRGATPPQRAEVPAAPSARETRLMIGANVRAPRLQLTWATPAYLAPGDQVLDVTARMLGHGELALLHRRLVDGGLADDVRAAQRSHQAGSEFEIVVTVRPGASVDAALSAVDEVLAALRAGPSAADVARGKLLMISETVLGEDALATHAAGLNARLERGERGELSAVLAGYEAVTPGAVQRAAVDLLPAGNRIVAIVTPDAGAPASGRLVGGL
jgi:zinc protease